MHAGTDLTEALRGADFVFSAMRVGGLEGRVCDERSALAQGVLGQETTGAGGVTYGLRTVPVAVRLARTVRDVAPQAWVINFTNPAGHGHPGDGATRRAAGSATGWSASATRRSG